MICSSLTMGGPLVLSLSLQGPLPCPHRAFLAPRSQCWRHSLFQLSSAWGEGLSRISITFKGCHHLVSLGLLGSHLQKGKQKCWDLRITHSPLQAVYVCVCESVRTVRAADMLAKNVCETCPANHGCLVPLLIRPCLPGNQSLCTLLCATNGPNFPVTI